MAAWVILGKWQKPFVTSFSYGDPIMRGLDKVLQAHIPGAQGQPHQRIKGGHFLQEVSGKEFAEKVNEVVASLTMTGKQLSA